MKIKVQCTQVGVNLGGGWRYDFSPRVMDPEMRTALTTPGFSLVSETLRPEIMPGSYFMLGLVPANS